MEDSADNNWAVHSWLNTEAIVRCWIPCLSVTSFCSVMSFTMNKENGHYSISFPEQPFHFVKIFIWLLISKCGLEAILCLCETNILVCHTAQLLHSGFAKGRSVFRGVAHSVPPLQMGKSWFVAVCETLSLFFFLFVMFMTLYYFPLYSTRNVFHKNELIQKPGLLCSF